MNDREVAREGQGYPRLRHDMMMMMMMIDLIVFVFVPRLLVRANN